MRKENEVLRNDTAQNERPNVSVPTDGSIVSLGKNDTTKIADMGLKRKCVSLQLKNDNELHILKAVPQQVSVNGALVEGDGHLLEHGDVLALHAPEIAYEFRVVVEAGSLSKSNLQEEGNASPASVSQDEKEKDETPATISSDTQLNSSIADEFCCAFCLEILVQATTIVPCGHSFCRGCVDQSSECPTCRGALQTTVPCRTLDNVIASMVSKSSSIFEADDVEKFHERSHKATPKKQKAKPSRHRKKRKAGDDALICID